MELICPSKLESRKLRLIYGNQPENEETCLPVNDKCYSRININSRFISQYNKMGMPKLDNIFGMLHRLLDEKKILRKKLARYLDITAEELEMLLSCKREFVLMLLPKISLPLIKLYCKSNFCK